MKVVFTTVLGSPTYREMKLIRTCCNDHKYRNILLQSAKNSAESRQFKAKWVHRNINKRLSLEEFSNWCFLVGALSQSEAELKTSIWKPTIFLCRLTIPVEARLLDKYLSLVQDYDKSHPLYRVYVRRFLNLAAQM